MNTRVLKEKNILHQYIYLTDSMIIITWEDYKKEMPQIHLQSVFSISLFLKQKVTTQAYNKNFQMHALSKNPRKCFVFSIDSPFKFRNSKIIK